MPFTVEFLATGEHNQAVKVMVLHDEEPSNTDIATWKASATAQFRVHYKEWPKTVKAKVTQR